MHFCNARGGVIGAGLWGPGINVEIESRYYSDRFFIAVTSPAGFRPSPIVRGGARCSSGKRAGSLCEASTAARSRRNALLKLNDDA